MAKCSALAVMAFQLSIGSITAGGDMMRQVCIGP